MSRSQKQSTKHTTTTTTTTHRALNTQYIRLCKERENVAHKAIEECGNSEGKNPKTYGGRARDKVALHF